MAYDTPYKRTAARCSKTITKGMTILRDQTIAAKPTLCWAASTVYESLDGLSLNQQTPLKST
jgi:hypothetical protein